MEPVESAADDRAEPRLPLLMDPAGARPSGFAPPPAGSTPPPGSASPAADFSSTTGGARSRARGPAHAASGTEPGTGSIAVTTGSTAVPTGPPGGSAATSGGASSSALPAGLVTGTTLGTRPGEAAFGPVSQVVRISVRTASSRLDLVLPDRSTFAETVETVLDIAPRSLREQAVAHGGWILRTASGDVPAGSMTLLDQGIVDGSTLFLTGADTTPVVVVYDDIADAVAATVRSDPSGWPEAARRPVALAAAGVFGAVVLVCILLAGPPWVPVAITLGVLAAVSAAVAGWLARVIGDSGAAVIVGIFAVAGGAAAATVATAASPPDQAIGMPQILLGGAAAILLAGIVGTLVRGRPVPFVAVITGSLVTCLAAACCHLFGLPAAAGAAIVVGVSLCSMPALPRLSLAFAGAFPAAGVGRAEAETPPWEHERAGPGLTGPGVARPGVDNDDLDPVAVRLATHRATTYLTAQLQGLSWAAFAGCTVLAVSGDAVAEVLAAVVAIGLLLRSRLFPTIGQRLPLLIAGIGSLVTVLLALSVVLDPAIVLIAVAAPALAAMIAGLLFAAGGRSLSPELARGLEILDVLTAVAVIPLVAVVLGLFEIVRGIGG